MADPDAPSPSWAAGGEADAQARDRADPLSRYRKRFLLPSGRDGAPAIYLAGQSLGLQPRTARAAIEAELDAWARLGVDAWVDPDWPWFALDDSLPQSGGVCLPVLTACDGYPHPRDTVIAHVRARGLLLGIPVPGRQVALRAPSVRLPSISGRPGAEPRTTALLRETMAPR